MAKSRKKDSARKSAAAQNRRRVEQQAPPEQPVEPEEDGIEIALEFLTVKRIIIGIVILQAILIPYAAIRGRAESPKSEAFDAWRNNRWKEVIRSFGNLAEKGVTDPDRSRLKMARAYLGLGDHEKALATLGEISKDADFKRSQKADYLAYTAWARQQAGAGDEAVVHARRALDIDQENAVANAVMARRLMDEGRYREASSHFEKLVGEPDFKNMLDQFRERVEKELLNVPDSQLQDVPERVATPDADASDVATTPTAQS